MTLTQIVAFNPDEARDETGKWTGDGNDKPAHHIAYSAWKRLPGGHFFVGERDYFEAIGLLRRARAAHKDEKHWVAMSLGASWHDPQPMGKIVSGKTVPEGVQEIRTGLNLRAAMKYMVQMGNEAFRRSRRAD